MIRVYTQIFEQSRYLGSILVGTASVGHAHDRVVIRWNDGVYR